MAPASSPSALDVPALCALVVGQSRQVFEERGYVTGRDRVLAESPGLTRQDHAIIAGVSRALLAAGYQDDNCEIHALLRRCTQPLSAWAERALGPDAAELRDLVLVDPDELLPTMDCRALAETYPGLTSGVETAIFEEFREAVARYFSGRREEAYSLVREWIIRNPVTTARAATEFLIGKRLEPLVRFVLQSVYEPVPLVPGACLCAHCGSLFRDGHCSLSACRNRRTPQPGAALPPPGEALRARRAVAVYWVGPGLDEIELYDRALKAGVAAELYPRLDACDVSLPGVGIDIKSYRSPFALAAKLNRSPGRVLEYPRKILAVADHLVAMNPHYCRQLREGLTGAATVLEVMPVGKVLGACGHA
jgi:hypothetical protein